MLTNHEEPVDLNSGRAFDEFKLESLIDSANSNELKEFIRARVESPAFKTKLTERDMLRTQLSKLHNDYEIVKGNIAGPNGKKVKGTRVAIREATLRYREVFEELAVIHTELNKYRELTAHAAAAVARFREDAERKAGTFLEYTEDTIGDLVATGSFESGSQEWHDQRSEGIGGSDVGAIMRVGGEYAYTNYRRMLLTKLGEPEENPSRDDRDDETTAIGRGNAWEPAILQRFADEHPELRIAHCKTSWSGKGNLSYRQANFDGLILDANGKPIGVAEIKTSSDASQWGDVSLGLWGVPAGYRLQILWYAVNAGLQFGSLIVLIDDVDYREYSFSMDDPKIQDEISKIMTATDTFWKLVIKTRAEKAAGKKTTNKRARGFGATPDYRRIADVLSAYCGTSPTRMRNLVLSTVAKKEQELGRPLIASENQELLTGLFADHNPATRAKPIYGIDIETSKASPRTGRIIETGIVEMAPGSEPKIVYSALHGVPDRVLQGAGIQFEEVHGINARDLEGKPLFEDPEVQREILALLKSGVMVAHNAGFEDRFLTANLSGYAEARDSGEIVLLDTRVLATMLMLASTDSSLNWFAEDNGVPYEGAHAAAADALMMMKALLNLQITMHEKRRFVSKRVTETERRQAIRDAIYAETTR